MSNTAQARAERWAQGKGLVALLKTLTPTWQHLVPKGKHDARAWDPADLSSTEVVRAYKRATILLHPDRMLQQDPVLREGSVRLHLTRECSSRASPLPHLAAPCSTAPLLSTSVRL